MKLFYAPASPFARKVHASIVELGMQDKVALQFTPVVPGQPNADYVKEHNPLGKIPALETDTGDILFDSTTICEYLDGLSESVKLLPVSGDERFKVLTRHSLAHGICEAAVIIRYETFLRPEDHQWDVWINDQWNKIDRALSWFNSYPDRWQGDVDLAQITLGCALGYLDFRSADRDWRSAYPVLKQWFDTWQQRESFKATLPTAEPVGNA